jgi:hypothetical protein
MHWPQRRSRNAFVTMAARIDAQVGRDDDQRRWRRFDAPAPAEVPAQESLDESSSFGRRRLLAGVAIADGRVAGGQWERISRSRSTWSARRLAAGRFECNVYGAGDDVFWLIATIHGNEAAGTPLVARSSWSGWRRIPKKSRGARSSSCRSRIPDGFADNVRFNRNGVDLNRNFPAGNWGEADVKPHGATPLSEPESRVLMRVLCQYFPEPGREHPPTAQLRRLGRAGRQDGRGDGGEVQAAAEQARQPPGLARLVRRHDAGAADHHARTAGRRGDGRARCCGKNTAMR